MAHAEELLRRTQAAGHALSEAAVELLIHACEAAEYARRGARASRRREHRRSVQIFNAVADAVAHSGPSSDAASRALAMAGVQPKLAEDLSRSHPSSLVGPSPNVAAARRALSRARAAGLQPSYRLYTAAVQVACVAGDWRAAEELVGDMELRGLMAPAARSHSPAPPRDQAPSEEGWDASSSGSRPLEQERCPYELLAEAYVRDRVWHAPARLPARVRRWGRTPGPELHQWALRSALLGGPSLLPLARAARADLEAAGWQVPEDLAQKMQQVVQASVAKVDDGGALPPSFPPSPRNPFDLFWWGCDVERFRHQKSDTTTPSPPDSRRKRGVGLARFSARFSLRQLASGNFAHRGDASVCSPGT